MDETENPFLGQQTVEKQHGALSILGDFLHSIVIAISISIFLYLFIITPNQVDGPSMQPNFQTGDLLFTSKLHKWFSGTSIGEKLGLDYKRGDVIVFQKPGLDDFVKRVIAVPGDTIAISNGHYIVNGEILDEQFQINNSLRKDGSFLQDGADPATIPDGYYFVSGDNRDVSYDSRELGFIARGWIKGRVLLRFWPLDKFGYISAGKFKDLGAFTGSNASMGAKYIFALKL